MSDKLKGKMVLDNVYKVKAGWVKRLGDGKVIGPFDTAEIARNSYTSPNQNSKKTVTDTEIETADKVQKKTKKIKKVDEEIPDLGSLDIADHG